MNTQHTIQPAGQADGLAIPQGGQPIGPSRGHGDRPRSWPVPVFLIVLWAIPLTAGTLTLADHRFAGFPLPLVLHIIGATVVVLVGAFQFVPRLRRRHPNWHRRGGRVLTLAGLMIAGSALATVDASSAGAPS